MRGTAPERTPLLRLGDDRLHVRGCAASELDLDHICAGLAEGIKTLDSYPQPVLLPQLEHV